MTRQRDLPPRERAAQRVLAWLDAPAQRGRLVYLESELTPFVRFPQRADREWALRRAGLHADELPVPVDGRQRKLRVLVRSAPTPPPNVVAVHRLEVVVRPKARPLAPPSLVGPGTPNPRRRAERTPRQVRDLPPPEPGVADSRGPVPVDPRLAADDQRTEPLVLATSPRVKRCLGEVVARRLAGDLGEAAHRVLAAYSEDLEERLAAECADVRVDLDAESAAPLRSALAACRELPGWAGQPGQGYAGKAPGWPAAASWQGAGYLWRGRARGASCGLPGTFRRVLVRGAEVVRYEAEVRGEVVPFLPLEWQAWEWCPADGQGRLVGW